MFTLPDLRYEYKALEPFIDEETMRLHHTKHHQAYVDNLNKIVSNMPELQGKSIEELLSGIEQIPPEYKQGVINHGGGHYNHSFFWKIMTANPTPPEKTLLDALGKSFESFEKFQTAFSEKAMSVFGSGWTFLVATPQKDLMIKRHSFQNPPIIKGNKPVLGIDVWEHAYYLKYQNRRVEYIENWWKVVNWQQVAANLKEALE